MGESRPATEVLRAFRSYGATGGTPPMRMCLACVATMPIDGATLSLVGKMGRRERVGSSDESSARADEIQDTLGDGPAFEAISTGGPVLVPDLASTSAHRWPAFVKAVSATEFRALFVFPLQIGAILLGDVSLYRRTPGPLSAEAHTDALRIADVLALLLLGKEGRLSDRFAEDWLEEPSWTREVHQATGMVIAQLGIGAEEALVRLRAFAFAMDLPLSDVARSVVLRRLRLPDAGGT